MSMFTANMTGTTNIPSLVFSLRDRVVGGIDEAARGAAEDALDVANELCPVRTGYLRSRNQIVAVSVGLQEAIYTVVNDASYAIFVILGTRYMRAQDFFTPAYVVGRASLERRVQNLLIQAAAA